MNTGPYNISVPGIGPEITVRDWFAISALSGILHSWGEVEGYEHNVKWAYKYADAMLAERSRKGES